MTVAFERITEFDKKSRAIRTMALDISKAIVMVSHAGLLHKFNTYGIPVTYLSSFCIFSVIDCFGWFCVRTLCNGI